MKVQLIKCVGQKKEFQNWKTSHVKMKIPVPIEPCHENNGKNKSKKCILKRSNLRDTGNPESVEGKLA